MSYSSKVVSVMKKYAEEWKKGDDLKNAGISADDFAVKRYKDIIYGPYGKYNLLDLNVPKNNQKKLPLIINIHGGGYFYGTKETYQYYCLFLAEQGFAVINFNYRLAPDFSFPANIEDIDHVMNWIVDNAEKYNLDLNNTFLVGDSAGGQMVVQWSAIYNNKKYRRLFGIQKPALKIRAAAANCPGFIIQYYRDVPQDQDVVYAAGNYFAEHQDHALVDLTKFQDYLSSSEYPLYVMTANDDFVRNQVLDLDKFLNDKKIKHEFHDYGDQDHHLHHVFHTEIQNEIAKECNLDEVRFFKEQMK